VINSNISLTTATLTIFFSFRGHNDLTPYTLTLRPRHTTSLVIICRSAAIPYYITYRQVRCMNIHQIRRRRRLVLSTTPTTSGTRTTWPGHVTRPFPTRSRVSVTRSTYYTSSSVPRETWSCWTEDEVRFYLKTTTCSAIHRVKWRHISMVAIRQGQDRRTVRS